MKKIAFLILTVLSIVALPGAVLAQNHIKDSIPAPAGTAALLLYYQYNTANEFYADGHESGVNLNYEQTMYVWRGAYYWGWGDGKWALCANVLVPFSSTETNDSRLSGMGDIQLNTGIFYKIAPKFWVSYDFQLGVPTADYDKDKTSNLGSNWWYIHNEINFLSYHSGNWTYEGYVDADFFTANDDYNNGSEIGKLEKDPLYYAQAFVTYDWTKALSTGIRYMYYNGGETEFNGVSNDDTLEKHSLMFEGAWMLNANTQLELSYVQDVKVEDGAKVTTAQARWAYFW